MNGFVNLLQIPFRFNPSNLDELASYYNSTALIDDLSCLISDGIELNQIQTKRVLLKPNWVKHSVTREDEFCLRTNDGFVLAALTVILKMGPSLVLIGDAPIQGCKWDKMISESFLNEIEKLSRQYDVPVKIKDFRRRTYNFSENTREMGIRPLSDYTIFNLGSESFLEPITTEQTRFRVTNYDPDRMLLAHSPGIHKYCITKELFQADVVISLPKIKTHQKTGITGALKNLVGLNGDKDFLPHHRIGGTKKSGDCYPGGSFLRYWSELLLDKANGGQGKRSFWFWQKLSSFVWLLSIPGPEHSLAAGWYGNDTTWRMVLDLNRVAEFGKEDGTISKNPQRQIFSLCDGIIAGQGDGPLEPKPLPLRVISFTNNSYLNDRAMATLMGLSYKKIPLLRNDRINKSFEGEITFNGKKVNLDELRQYSVKTLPPRGWANYFNETI